MKQRPWRSSENAGAKPSKDRRTYVSASQEETLKASMRLGLLGLFAVLAAAFGVSQIGTVSAQPPGVTKNCALTGGGAITGPVPTTSTVTCTIILDATVVAVAEPVTISVTGATVVAATATGVLVDAVAVVPGGVVVGCIGATCSGVITIVEVLQGIAGMPLDETIRYGANPAVALPEVPTVVFVVPNAPVGLGFICESPAGIPALPTPGPIGTFPIAIGVLPQALVCQVIPVVNPALALTAQPLAAPGTIEVSSINGALIDASGALRTNLRIACGNFASAAPSCRGVAFAVAGLQVGFVEIRARYEPAPISAGAVEVEADWSVAFIAPLVGVNLLLNPNPIVVGATGTATARFNRGVVLCGAGLFCVDPTTGLPIFANAGSVLNGSTIFTIDNSLVASWTGAAGTNPGSLPSTAGFTVTANQVVARCGFFPTTGLPAAGFPGTGPNLGSFFGGCESNSATYRGNNPGVTNISATFVPDLPGAYGVAGVLGTTIAPSPVLPANFTALLGGLGLAQNPTAVRALEVTGAVPSGAVALARGCNNVSPTVTEAAAAYAARVTPQSALVAIWEHQAATNTFRGFSPQPGAPNDLAGVTRLRPVFVCVNAAANLDQPAA